VFGSFLLWDIEVHDVLGSVLELAQLLPKTCISRKRNRNHNPPRHGGRLSNNKQDANLAGSPWTSLIAVNWLLIADSSFLRVSSVS
jgi:hypothetical protein